MKVDNLLSNIRNPRVRTFALVGRSGTGKSFRAQLVAEKYHIQLIIDDGLLIRNYQMQYPYLRQSAIRQNPFIVTNGVLKSPSNEEYAMAVRANPAVLNLIRSRETREAIEEMLSGGHRTHEGNDQPDITDDLEER